MLGCLAFGLAMWCTLGFAHPLAWMSTLFSAYFLVGVQNWIQPSRFLGFRSYVDIEATLRIAVPGLLAFIAGALVLSGVRRLPKPTHATVPATAHLAGKLLVLVGLLGLAVTIQRVGLPILDPAIRAEAIHGPWAICTYALIPAALLLTMNRNGRPTSRDVAIIAGFALLLLLLAYRSPVLLLIGTFLISRLVQGRLRRRTLILGGIGFLVFGTLIFSYRAHAAGPSQYVVPAGPLRNVPALLPLYLGFMREGVSIFARLHELVPSSTPFMHGALQASMFHLHSGATSPREYVYDIVLGTNTARTTYTPTILGGPYVDFGIVGVLSEMFVLGLLSGWLYRLAHRARSQWPVVAYGYWTILLVLSIHTGLLDYYGLVIVPAMVVLGVLVADTISARRVNPEAHVRGLAPSLRVRRARRARPSQAPDWPRWPAVAASMRSAVKAQRLAVTTVAFAFSGATTLVFTLVLVRVLSSVSYGVVARTFALGMAVAQLTMAGIAPAIAREVAHAQSDDLRFARARGAIRVLAYWCGLASLLYFPLALVGLGPTNTLSLLLGWALGLVYSLYFGLKLLLFTLDRSATYAALELLSDAIFFATLVALALVAPAAGVLTFSVAYLFFVLAATRLIRRHGSTTIRLPVDRKILKYTTWAFVATYASVGRVPITVALTGAIAGSALAGRIAALLAIIIPFFLLSQAAAVLSFADVARARAAGGDGGVSVRLMCRVSGWVSALTIPTCCLFAHQIVELALGARYSSAVSSFVILIICLAPQTAAQPAAQALAAKGAVVANAAMALGAFAILIAGIVLLVPRHGLLGAAIAASVSMVVMGVAALVRGHLRFGIGLREVAGTLAAVGLGLVAVTLNETPLLARIAIELVFLAVAALAARQIRWTVHEPRSRSTDPGGSSVEQAMV